MKLQPKRQINNELSLLRKNQIDEGLKLARKIDALRETLASLESQHQKFLAGSRAEIENATKDNRKELEVLKSEIKKLEERRKELLKPLDDKWAEFEEEKKAHTQLVKQFQERNEELTRSEKLSKKEVLRLEKQAESIADKEKLADAMLKEAKETRKKAQSLSSQKAREYDAFSSERDTRAKELEYKEKELLIQANFNTRQEEILNIRSKKLDDRERAINDKYQTLMRTIKRLEK